MSCKCNGIASDQSLSSNYFKNVGGEDMAVYATIQPTQQAKIPYWCSATSAFNDSDPTGYISLNDPTFQKALPVDAKHSLRMLIDDVKNGITKGLDYYGTVFNLGGKTVKYDPNLMKSQVNVVPKETFLQDATTTAKNAVPGTSNTGNGSASRNALDEAKELAAEHPAAVGGGLLLLLFGIATLISSK